MKKSVISICAVATCMVAGAANASERTFSCYPLHPKSPANQNALVKNSGCYFLEHDWEQGALFNFSEGGRRGSINSELLTITAEDVTIDLGGHTLGSNAGIGGIASSPGRYTPQWIPLSPNEVHRLIVRNGAIILSNADNKATNYAITSPDEIALLHGQYEYEKFRSIYRKVEYRFENLTINARNAAAVLAGDGIIIRNCTIEVDSRNALVIYGANAIIENNRIVLHRTKSDSSERSRSAEQSSAIYLRNADNALVRENSIVVDTDDDTPMILSVDSKNVHVERNRFNRRSSILLMQGQSSASLIGNLFKEGFFAIEVSVFSEPSGRQ
jgi:hypothetical protein